MNNCHQNLFIVLFYQLPNILDHNLYDFDLSHVQDHTQSHLAGLVLEHVKSSDPFVLKAREFSLIHKFDTYNNGLNKEP